MAWCWTFFVTLGAGERFITSVGSFISLYGLIVNICSHTGSNWMVYNWFGLFHVRKKCLRHVCHNGNSWMAYHQCGSFQLSLKGLKLNNCCHTGSNRMVYHRCGFFHVSSNCLMLRTGSNWMVNHRCGFYLVHIQNHKKSPEVQRMFCLPSRKLNWHTTKAYQMCCS